MSVAQTETDIYPIIVNNWTLTDISYPNVKFEQSNVPYIRINIAEAYSEIPCIDGTNKTERTRGDIVGSLFIPRNMTKHGGKRGTEIAEDFKNMLSQQRFGSTITFSGRVVDAGLSDDENWYRYNVLVSYETNINKP